MQQLGRSLLLRLLTLLARGRLAYNDAIGATIEPEDPESMNRIWRHIVLIALLLSIGTIATAEIHAAPFQGKVVDAETGEPLEGTVIVAVWYRPVFGLCMDSCTTYHDAAEAVADAGGNFSIDLSMGWLAIRRTIVIYKPGYHAPGYFTYPWIHSADGPQPSNGEIIRLIKIKRRDDPRVNESSIGWCTDTYDNRWCVPQRKVRNYIRLFELEQKIQGY